MLPSPLSAPPAIFTGRGSSFLREGGTLCTLYTYAAGGVGAREASGEGQVPSPACGALPPRPPDRGK